MGEPRKSQLHALACPYGEGAEQREAERGINNNDTKLRRKKK